MPRIFPASVVIILVMTGCAPGPPVTSTAPPATSSTGETVVTTPWEDTAEKQFFREMAFNAEVEGSGQPQIDMLIEAGASGVLLPERVEELLPALFDCLADAGATGVRLPDAEVAPGLTYLDYRVDFSATEGDALAVQERAVIDCELEHFAFAWQAIHRQPAVP